MLVYKRTQGREVHHIHVQSHKSEVKTMAVSLRTDQQKQLSRWLDGNRKFELLYRASRDGCGAASFHSKCDNKGETVVVVRNGAGYTFGGYANMNWNTKTSMTFDQKAFIFRLDEEGDFDPKIYRVKDAEKALYNWSSRGPTFGQNELIVCCLGPFIQSGGYFPCEFKVALAGTYDMKGDTADDLTGGNTQIAEIEVFKVTDKATDLDEPWRNVGETELEKIKSEIEEYMPLEELKLSHVNIMLVGAVGSGKSSYFNTINSMFRGHVTGQARSGSAATILTSTFMAYKVRCRSGRPMKFRLCDTRGLEEEKGTRVDDLVAVLDGHIENGFQFNPFVKLDQSLPGYRKTPAFSDTMHCVAFVVDASTVDVYPDKILKIIKEFQETANFRGVPQVILLTKVDKVCPSLDTDLSTLYSNVSVFELVDTVAQMIGLPRSCVLPIKNYEKETELVPAVDLPAIISLRQVLRAADDYLYYCLDKQEP